MSRSPRVDSAFGAYESRARIEPSSGNPLKAVFAARSRTAAVVAWMTKNSTELLPKVAAAICAMSERCGVVAQFAKPCRSQARSA